MNDDFAVFIVTYKRANNQLTYNYLKNNGYSGKIYFVLSDDDPTIPEYQEKFGLDKCLVFNKQESLSLFDIGDNFDDERAVVYARNKLYDLAAGVGIKWALVLDDDYTKFDYRIDSKTEYPSHKFIVKSIVDLIDCTYKYFVSTGAVSVAFAQGGDFIGGGEHVAKDGWNAKRKVMNSFFFCIDNPLEFQGRINEDLTASVIAGLRGKLVLTIPFASLTQLETQANSGGLTDIYLNMGTYVKSFYSVMMAPSCVKIAAMGDVHKRIHHQVSWNNAASKIISDKYRKTA
jgi:hypothetical protein